MSQVGYYGQPVLKAPVWTWEIPLYFFVGGAAGMAAVIALPALALRASVQAARAALWIAAAGALLSPLLLVKDLGRPSRFYNMLRVLKWRSPMSVGVWLLVAFTAVVLFALTLLESLHLLVEVGLSARLLASILMGSMAAAAVLGALLATYTGVLLGATAVPVWNRHRRLLPMHFGVTGLGSAAALVELVGPRLPALFALGLCAAALETLLLLLQESSRHGAADRALRRGRAAWAVRGAALLTGPGALALRLGELVTAAAIVFLAGALLGRYGWLWAGRASALDPQAALSSE